MVMRLADYLFSLLYYSQSNGLAMRELFSGMRDNADVGVKKHMHHSVWNELTAMIPRKRLNIQQHAFRQLMKGLLDPHSP